MHGGQTFTLSGAIEPAKLVIPQGDITVSPFHIGTGALEYLRQLLGLLPELAELGRAQLGSPPTGVKQRRAQPLGQLSKRLASAHRTRLGDALKIGSGNEMGMQCVGH